MTARGLLCATLLVAACGAPPSDGTTSNSAEAQPVSNAAKARPAAAGTGEAGARSLILEFPDGARGGHGRIQGQARWDGHVNHEILLDRITSCGAANPRIVDAVSHRIWVVSDSTPRDRDVVRCVMRTVPFDFNAGVASDNPRESSHMYETPFREFETAIGNSR